MSNYKITDVLELKPFEDGALLQFMSQGDGGLDDFFSVGMSPATLGECRRALDSFPITWKNRDKSLTITGNGGETTFTFTMLHHPHEDRVTTINGVELAAFKAALDKWK